MLVSGTCPRTLFKDQILIDEFGDDGENRYISCGDQRKNANLCSCLSECPSLIMYDLCPAMSKPFVTVAAFQNCS